MGKVLLYFLIPGLAAIAPLIVIPAITSRFGSEGWAAVAIAMSLGNAGAVLAELGWGVVGPQRISRNPESRHATYREALGSKLVAFVLVAIPSAVASALLAPDYQAAAVLLTIALVGNGLTPSWYYIGLGRPMLLLSVETLPRLAMAIIAAVSIAAGAPLETYGLALMTASVLVYALSSWLGQTPMIPDPPIAALGTIRRQSVLILGRGISTLYTSLPTALLAIVAPSAVAQFSAADRPMRMGLSVLGGLPARLQAWIGVTDPAQRRLRAKQSLWINAGLGVGAGASYALIMPPVATVLFSGTINVPYSVSILGGVLVALICTSRGFGLALVAEDRANWITIAVCWAAPIGAVGVIILGGLYGVEGAFLGLILAEIAGIVAQTSLLFRAWRPPTPGR